MSKSKLVLEGITNWNFDRLKGTVGIFPPSYTLEYTISNPLIKWTDDYEIDARIMENDVFGKGKIE